MIKDNLEEVPVEVKPSFFSITGFLVPGIVLASVVTWLLAADRFESATKAIDALPKLPSDSGVSVLLTTLAIASLLGVAFVLGAILSETFTYVVRQLIIRPLLRPALRENVTRLFAHKTLEELIRADMDARESYVYLHTSGLDLHWYAGRIRMLGASGLALLVSAGVAACMHDRCAVVFGLFVAASVAICVALYRSNKFDLYIAAASAVLLREGALVSAEASSEERQ